MEQKSMRREPMQKRSRERVDHILACASRLILRQGSEPMRMSELAELSGISIGSLYQYFPDKAAVIRTLAERFNAQNRHCIAQGLAGVRTVADLRPAFATLVDEYYAIFRAEPVMRDVWFAMQANAELRAFEHAESLENAKILASALHRVFPQTDAGSLEAKALLVMHLGESAMRLALSLGEARGRQAIEGYKAMALRALTSP